MLITFIILFLFSSVFLLLARRVAISVGLVDKPNYRKRHQGAIPLVGGISVYVGICLYFILYWNELVQPGIYLICAGVLVLTGVLDDRYDISVKLRVSVQTIVALIMMLVAGLYIRSLGFILGPWELQLGYFGYVITLFAVWAAINAFNMVDGIDGLLGGLSSVTLAALGMLLYLDGQPQLAAWCFAIIVIILPYILLNLGVLGRQYKVFMGDAGSTLIGFTVIWIILQSTQGVGHPMNPVTALWVIAIPLMDMVATMYRRISKGKSPFSADRQHIHHILMRSGFSARQTFVLITLSAAILAAIGVLGEHVSFMTEWMMLLLFFIIFMMYGYCIKRAWRLARFIRRYKRHNCH
jgi:UDP-GlcNAc:undecaprenyl-phosphate GlcNAc-1-phosphate transferase